MCDEFIENAETQHFLSLFEILLYNTIIKIYCYIKWIVKMTLSSLKPFDFFSLIPLVMGRNEFHACLSNGFYKSLDIFDVNLLFKTKNSNKSNPRLCSRPLLELPQFLLRVHFGNALRRQWKTVEEATAAMSHPRCFTWLIAWLLRHLWPTKISALQWFNVVFLIEVGSTQSYHIIKLQNEIWPKNHPQNVRTKQDLDENTIKYMVIDNLPFFWFFFAPKNLGFLYFLRISQRSVVLRYISWSPHPGVCHVITLFR